MYIYTSHSQCVHNNNCVHNHKCVHKNSCIHNIHNCVYDVFLLCIKYVCDAMCDAGDRASKGKRTNTQYKNTNSI